MKTGTIVQTLFVGGCIIGIVLGIFFYVQVTDENSRYQQAVCTLHKIDWIQEPSSRVFVDKNSTINVTVAGQTFLYTMPQRCSLPPCIATLASNCPTVGAQTHCWAHLHPLFVKNSLRDPDKYMAVILPSAILGVAYVVLWIYYARTTKTPFQSINHHFSRACGLPK